MPHPNFPELHFSGNPAKRIVISGPNARHGMAGAMRAFTAMLWLAAATCAGSLSVQAQASEAQISQSCDIRCLGEQVTKLEGDVAQLTTQLNSMKTLVDNSIQLGQSVKMEMPNGCLSYVGPSGDIGGFVSWSKNCSLGTAWRIK